MRLSIFKISILLIIIGASGTGIIFSEADRSSQLMSLKQTESDQISMFFEEFDILLCNDAVYYAMMYEGKCPFFKVIDEFLSRYIPDDEMKKDDT